ncbi:MAG: hypothetical protein E6H58_03765, partial [Betaproteobacteria bacterium]
MARCTHRRRRTGIEARGRREPKRPHRRAGHTRHVGQRKISQAAACPARRRIGAVVRAAIDEHCAALKSAEVDTVVLGCTHYAFVREQIEIAMGPRVQIIDTAEAVARQAVRLLPPLLGEAAAAMT